MALGPQCHQPCYCILNTYYPKVALRQIERKDYPLPWSVDKRTIFLIGLNFSSKTRRLEDWEIGQKSTGKDAQKSTGKDAKKSTGKKLGKTAEKIVELMRDNPNITIPDLAIAVHTNERNIEKHTSNLQAKGIIRRVDGRKEGYWQVLI